MATDLKSITTQGKALWAKLPRTGKIVAIGAVIATIVAVALLTRTTEPKYALVFAGLSPEDAGEVVAALQAEGVPYKVEAGGSAISVPAGQELDLRLRLASKGVPRGGGVGFEIFDKQKFGTTSFVEQMNYRRALQGELARTIGALDAVEAARVHLALGERSLYKQDDQPPSASVVLRLRGGRSLAPGQVKGIVNLVASSVDGMRADRVTVVDERGEVLSGNPDDDAEGGQRALERSLARRITEMLERIVGPGHVTVSVTGELDRSQVTTSEESFADKPVVRSESRSEERVAGSEAPGGLAGARGNLPGAPAPATGVANDPGLVRTQQTANYEVSKVVKNVIGPKVKVARLHVAVLVDGVPDAKGVKVPRGADELARIEALARDAAGLDATRGDRITVQSAPFSISDDETTTVAAAAPKGLIPGLPVWAPFAGGGALLLIAMGALFLRRKKKVEPAQVLPALPVTVDQLERSMMPGASPAPQLAGAPTFDRSARERAIEAAREDSDRAANVLTMWLSEGRTADSRNAGGVS
jgi:flagellar M-ring protein FliF